MCDIDRLISRENLANEECSINYSHDHSIDRFTELGTSQCTFCRIFFEKHFETGHDIESSKVYLMKMI